MNKLYVVGDSYNLTYGRQFNGRPVSKDLLKQVFDFSYEMCFGSGYHRSYRSGGQTCRRAGEQFCNTFQGKLAEVVLYNYLTSKQINCKEPDFGVYGYGVWDNEDLSVYGSSISIKSAAHFSNLLLLETKDYDYNGNYIPNLNTQRTTAYDYYMLIRFNPDIKSIFRTKRLLYSDYIDKSTLEKIIFGLNWEYDFAGYVTHNEFVNAIREHNIIPQNAFLNGRTQMDASNYYIQAGDLNQIDTLCPSLFEKLETVW